MSINLSTEWPRCLDGVELSQWAPGTLILGKPVSEADTCLRYKSTQDDILKFETGDFRESLVVKFASAVTDKKLLEFVSEYGFPNHPDIKEPGVSGPDTHSLKMIRSMQKHLRKLLMSPQSSDQPEDIFNESQPWMGLKPGGAEMYVYLKRDESESRHSLWLVPQDLYDFMMVEAGLIMCGNAVVETCLHCSNPFIAGGEKAKRSHSKYCSPRCRLAAWRAEKKREG